MPRGRFISFEGGEGTGKSTQARLLAQALRARGHDCILTREPGGTPLGEEIRRIVLSDKPAAPETELLLFAAARVEHVHQVIRPALERGAIVICDRYVDSTRVYQGALGHVDRQLIDVVERATLQATDLPELTFVLDLDPEIGLSRATERGALNRYDAGHMEAHRTIRDGFLAVARAAPQRCVVVDAAGSMDQIASSILAEVESRRLMERA